MRKGKNAIRGRLFSTLVLLGLGTLLAACNTVAGAGQDVSAVGHAVTTGASQTQRATHAP